ncbi:MAG: diguanylate cyclase [Deltaproteobacteria bacterium]|nr:diguanylate cyclase [Candidatus Tharpella aukensis]
MMLGPYRAFVFLLYFSSTVTMGLSFYAFLQRKQPGALAFSGLTLMMTVLSLGSYFAALSGSQAAADFWCSKIRFVGMAYIPVFFLVFVLAYESRYNFLTLRNIFLLFFFPLLTLVIVFTNNYHGLFFQSVEYVRYEGLFLRTSWRPGSWFWIHTAYSYALVLLAMSILLYRVVSKYRPYKNQALLMLVGALAPFFANILVTWRLTGDQALDYTSFAFTLSGLTMGFALFHYRLLDLVPIARDTVIECIDDVVIVLDRQLRVVDANPAAQNILSPDKLIVGGDVHEFLPVSYDFGRLLADVEKRQVEMDLVLAGGRQSVFDLRISKLRKPNREWVGILIVARDVSERVDMVDDRERMILDLEEAKAELTRWANFDFLTEINSRRYFIEVAGKELVRSLRYRRPLSLIMMDIDHFKVVNDTFGHEVGDRVLVEVAQAIKTELRQIDVLARFGGEEFIVLLPESCWEQARMVAEKIRIAIAELKIEELNPGFRLTISLGIAGKLADDVSSLSDLLRLADTALYAAKKAGRNCVRS